MSASEIGRPARIKDVAARAGVSLKTVTNVVHERPYVADHTRQRVLAAIDDLGYRPSMAGRQLRSGRSNILTLAVPRIDEPYLGSLAHALIDAATPRGYTVLIDETGGRPERERQAAEGYPGHNIDGVIFSPLALDPRHLAAVSTQTPMVLLGAQLADGAADYVAIDNAASAREVVRHLLTGGRRHIAFLGGQPHRPAAVGQVRMEGARRELAAAGVAPRPDWLVSAEHFNREEGGRLALELHRGSPEVDALICASDLLAIGALGALQRVGVRVPDDIAVTGWDDIVDGRYTTPTLTTVAPDLALLAERTLDALSRRIEGDRSDGMSFVVPHELVVRESSARSG